MTDMTAEQALEWLQTIAAISGAVVSDRPLSFSYQEAVRFQEAVKALTAPRVPDSTSDDAPARIIGGIGNELHNLSCRHQNDEELCDELSGMRDRLWDIQKLLTAAPAPADSEQLKCNTCGESTDDPWHYSLVGNRHLHACDACWRSVNPAIADKIVPLMERVAELEGYNIGLANESHELRERVKVLEARESNLLSQILDVANVAGDGVPDAIDNDGQPYQSASLAEIIKQAARLRGGSDE